MNNLEKYLPKLKEIIGTEQQTITVKGYTYIKTPDWESDFIIDFHDNEEIDKNYMENYELIDQTKEIEYYTKYELWTMLTYYIRKDRFVEGSLNGEMRNGTIYNLVYQITIKANEKTFNLN